MKFNKIALAGALAGMLSSGSALALQQGTVGPTSEGRVDISVTIPDLIRINGLNDATMAFGTYSGTGGLTATSPAAVCSNGAATYGLVATSVNGSFALVGATAGNTDTIAYTVSWTGAGALTYNTNAPGLAVESTSLGAGCTATAGKLSVNMSAVNLAVTADDYTDTVILTVTPE